MVNVLFLMGSWKAPSEQFLYRQLQMLKEAEILECIVAAGLHGDTHWNDILVYGLNGDTLESASDLSSSKPHLPTQLEMLQKALLRTQSNTILCQYGTMAVLFYPILKSVSQRLLIHVHGKDTHEHMHAEDYRKKFETLAKRATIICSPVTFNRLKNWNIPQQNLVVKTYGVEVPDRPVYRMHSSKVTILHLGRLIDCKSPDRTIQAFERACSRGLEGNLIIVGDGPLRVTCELLRVRSKWRDRISILGHVSQEDANSLRLEADIFTQHSIKGELTGQVEAFGVSIVEAMAASLPVVSCPIGGIKNIVVDGETGILVESGNVDAHAEALLKLACDPDLRNRMGEAGWCRAKEHYSYATEKEQLLSILMNEPTKLIDDIN